MNKVAILIRGASASGKTSTARALMERLPDLVNIHLDDYRNANTELSHTEQRGIAHKQGLEDLDRLTQAQKSLVIDEQFRPEFYEPVVKMLTERGYKIINVVIEISLEHLLERDKGRKKPIGNDRLEVLAKRAERIEGELDGLKQGSEIRIDSTKTSIDDAVGMIVNEVEKNPELKRLR